MNCRGVIGPFALAGNITTKYCISTEEPNESMKGQTIKVALTTVFVAFTATFIFGDCGI